MTASKTTLFGYSLWAICIAAFSSVSNAASIPLTWMLYTTYTPLTATCGDSIAFSWSGSIPHGVVKSSDVACPNPFPKFASGKFDTDALGNSYELLNTVSTSGTVNYTFTSNGVFYFQCQVGAHCLSNMNQKVTVTGCTANAIAGAKAPSLAPGPAPAPGPQPGSIFPPRRRRLLKALRSFNRETMG